MNIASGSIARDETERNDEPEERLLQPPFSTRLVGDARHVPLQPGDADMVVTSPPYWLKRDYGVEGQIGQEATAEGFVGTLVDCMENWKSVLPRWGSVFINIGDTYHNGSLANTPGRLEFAAHNAGWTVRNRILAGRELNVSALRLISLKAGLMYAVNAIDEAIDSSA